MEKKQENSIISKLQAQLEQKTNEAEGMRSNWYKCVERLRQVAKDAERGNVCHTCVYYNTPKCSPLTPDTGCKGWKWRGVQKAEGSNCIMPEMPYCPSCEYGRIEYPEWVETYDDTYDSGCEWVCSLGAVGDEECVEVLEKRIKELGNDWLKAGEELKTMHKFADLALSLGDVSGGIIILNALATIRKLREELE